MYPEHSLELGAVWAVPAYGAVLRVLYELQSNPEEMETNQYLKPDQNGKNVYITSKCHNVKRLQSALTVHSFIFAYSLYSRSCFGSQI